MAGTYERSVFDCPCRSCFWVAGRPAGQILAVEQRYRRSPLWSTCPLQRGRSLARPRPRSSVGTGGGSHQRFSGEFAHKDHVVFSFFLFFGGNESDLAIRQFTLWERARVSPAAHHASLELTVFLRDL